jgi:hypothetical protein
MDLDEADLATDLPRHRAWRTEFSGSRIGRAARLLSHTPQLLISMTRVVTRACVYRLRQVVGSSPAPDGASVASAKVVCGRPW